MSDIPAAPAVTEQTAPAAPAETVPSVAVDNAAPQGSLQGPDGQAPGTPEAATTGEADDGAEAQKSSNKVPYRERIEQLVHARREAEKEAAYWRTVAEQQKQAQQPGQGQQQLDPMAYASDAEYQAAMQRELARNVSDAVRQEMLANQQRVAESRAVDAREQVWGERSKAFRDRAPDFEQVALGGDHRVTPFMAELIKESEHGPEIAYWLGKNPNDSARIASLPPQRAAMEIGALGARFAQPAAPRFTQAPAPVKTISQGSATPQKAPQDMTFREYEAMRLAQMQNKAR